MSIDRNRTLRGALAGATAATVWWAQQRADMRGVGVPYDDAELLGTGITRGPASRPLGIALHVANGAAFGARCTPTWRPACRSRRGPRARPPAWPSTWPAGLP